MQQATVPRLHVRDARDAHILFEAVRRGFLQPVRRRLNEMERAIHVRSGAIFVWVECEDDAGLKRWTDGRVWGQSRMREPYLFYDEKLPYDNAQGPNESRAPAFRFVDGVSRNAPTSSALSHQERTTNHHKGLVKQAYSAWVTVNPYAPPQKWHLTAYFTYADLPHLPTVNSHELLSTIDVPLGIYRSGKSRARDDEESGVQGSYPSTSTTPSRAVPSLPPLQAAIGHHATPSHSHHPRLHGGRLPEDQRVIQMLNSRYI